MVAAPVLDSGCVPRQTVVSSNKRPIVTTRTLDVDSLDAAEIDALIPRLLAIHADYFRGLSEAQLRAMIVDRGPGTRLILMYGPRGELAGFGSYRLEPVRALGGERLVFSAGAYSRKGYKGAGAHMMRQGLRGAAAAKLRRPWRPLDSVMQMANEVAYASMARPMARVYPDPEFDTPAWVVDLVRTVARERGLELAGDDPFVVRNPFPIEQPERERLLRSQRLRDDPYIRLFRERCPNPGDVLLTYHPLDLGNLLASGLPGLRRLNRRLRRTRARRTSSSPRATGV